MIPTLVSSSYLYKVNKNRQRWLTELEIRKAIWLICFVIACLAIVLYVLIISFR